DRTMDRRTFLTTFACLLIPAVTVEAQQPANVFRIGILGTYPPTAPEFAHLWEAFVHGLRDLGYIEGQNLVVDRRFMEGKAEGLPRRVTDKSEQPRRRTPAERRGDRGTGAGIAASSPGGAPARRARRGVRRND